MEIIFRPELWYFAHPYSSLNEAGDYVLAGEEANFRLCCYRTAQLILDGWLVYSPIAHTHPIHVAHPAFVGQQAHDIWYKFDNQFLEIIPFVGVILAPGWERSKGCQAEKSYFEQEERQIRYLHRNGTVRDYPETL